jgi:hypothetical protein
MTPHHIKKKRQLPGNDNIAYVITDKDYGWHHHRHVTFALAEQLPHSCEQRNSDKFKTQFPNVLFAVWHT